MELTVTPVNVCMCTEEDDKLQCPVISYIDNHENTKTTFLSPLITREENNAYNTFFPCFLSLQSIYSFYLSYSECMKGEKDV